VLVLGHADGLSERLVRALQASAARAVIHVEHGAGFAEHGAGHYTVRAAERPDFERLLRDVEAAHGPVSDVCHLWSLDPADVLERGFHSLVALAQALAATSPAKREVSITVVTSGLEDVTGTEPLCPLKASLHGPCKVIPQEIPGIECRLVDVVTGTDEHRLVQQIVAEIDGAPDHALVAYRGPHRWVKGFEPMSRDPSPPVRLRKQGVYLITGGLGGVGLALARHLAGAWQARLVLLGRSELPPRERWSELAAGDGDVAARVRGVLELEALGAEVCVWSADVADAQALDAAIVAARQRFGDLHGVIHAAGVAGGGVIVHKTRATVEQVFAPKIEGTLNLLRSLTDAPPDFVLLCSALSAIAGGFGQVDYCAANSVLDALAIEAGRHASRVIAVNWDAWREVGMAAAQRLPEGIGITAEQGGKLLEAVLSGPPAAQIVVSSIELDQRLAQLQSPALAQQLVAAPVVKRRLHDRPALSTPYAQPQSELEQDLAALWGEFLGLSRIGIHDNLFELGGDSLLAIQLLARVRSAYGVELHPADLFKTPTVAALAVLVEIRLIEQIESADETATDTAELVV
jgi:NAD(P)-dependent dehydrogenase (short-subunit alcohol dehydrogenase family)/acyl carrier protein